MASQAVRKTVVIPTELLDRVADEVRKGGAKSRNDFFVTAIARELKTRRRKEIDDAFADMANDEDYKSEARQIMSEFAVADSETWKTIDSSK